MGAAVSDDLRDLDDDDLVNEWVHFKYRHDEPEWVAELGRRSRRIGERPSGPVTAWRASDVPEGMSWTERHIARHYVGQRPGATLWKATIRPGAILAVIEAPAGWTEYVVDPSKLGRVTEDADQRTAGGARGRLAEQSAVDDGSYERTRERLRRNTERRKVAEDERYERFRERLRRNTEQRGSRRRG